jgi:hypothetical protein
MLRYYVKVLGVDTSIILIRIFKKQAVRVRTDLSGSGQGLVADSRVRGSKPSSPIKAKYLLLL